VNRIDRLFGILLMFQTHRLVRSQDIAARFEISERTVYRDIAALLQLGVPIIARTGEGYALSDGYFLPPLIFTEAEASALFLAASMLKASGNLEADVQQALDKLKAALPARTLRKASADAEMIQFFIPKGRFNLSTPYLATLKRAINEQCVVFIHYHSWSEQVTTEREIEPLELSFSNGAWYCTAFCRLRRDLRDFRLERIEMLRLTTQQFSRDTHNSTPAADPIEVVLRFDASSVRWVHERQHYGFIDEMPDQVDSVIMRYRVERLVEMKHWLLSWGSAAQVLEPEALRQMLREEVEKMLHHLT
jgi:predicted DNA-binding transcriptional regulator YafY